LSEILKFAKSSEIFTLLLTSDGKRLLSISDEILSSVDAVRISVHGLYDDHDKIVKRNGAFQEIETAVEFLHSKNIPIMVTTVVTPKCIDHIENIADWAYSIHSTQYYLFGLMRSGKGNNFINKNEMIKPNWIESINAKVKEKYFGKMEVVYYGYENKGECVIVYGDGKILIDPYPGESTHQKILGNLLTDTKDHILKAFNEDPENSVGYDKHCKNI
jgi:MoaA/NifB/PqqE/SkfB family radical SAM enzyme